MIYLMNHLDGKQKGLKGEEYTSRENVRRKKKVQEFNHTCRYECSKFTDDERKRLFCKLYKLSTYDLQINFLASQVRKTAPKRGMTDGKKKYSTEIRLFDRRVCRESFLKTFDITDGRFKIICKKIARTR